MAVPPAPVRVPSQRPLATSITFVTSVANDKGDNEMIPGAVHRSPDIGLRAEENIIIWTWPNDQRVLATNQAAMGSISDTCTILKVD